MITGLVSRKLELLTETEEKTEGENIPDPKDHLHSGWQLGLPGQALLDILQSVLVVLVIEITCLLNAEANT